MDLSRVQPTDWSSVQPSFSPLLQYDESREVLNHTFSFHSSIMLPSTLNSPTATLNPPLPSLLPSSLLNPTLILTPLLSSSQQTPTFDHDPLSSTFYLKDLANLESMFLWSLHEPSTIALTVMYCLSFILGFVGNLMSLRVLTNRRSRQLAGVSATRSLLVNLAVCDLAVVLVCMPITLGSQIYSGWVYGDLLCRAVPFTQAVSVSASVLTLTVISVNRYYSVRSPLRARSMFTSRRILATVAVVWTVSSIICAPIAVMNRRREISFGTFAILICEEKWPQHRLKQGYNVLLFVMLYCDFGEEKKSTFADLDPRSKALHASRLKMRQKIAKMVVCLVLLFAVSWLPLYLADLWIDCEQRPPSWLLQTRAVCPVARPDKLQPEPHLLLFHRGSVPLGQRDADAGYYQKVASFFGSSTFSSSAAAASPSTVITDSKGTSAERRHIAAAAVAASASIVAIPRMLSLARGQGLGQRVGDSSDSRAGSDHSISDWCRSSPTVCDSSLFPCQLQIQHLSVERGDFLPSRRHSVNENAGSLPLGIESVEIGTFSVFLGITEAKTSQTYFQVEEREEETTTMTSL
ncbi:hypothetical protein KUCAC02_015390 [Chaenocephalus aceratus]|uniref:Uncharacterized protein n=1 Tax=Chaenocephalus aceratus TaxID=36190 RepID=A0ACB9XZF4_CHAAC|nr:hypothetical protein KUCAC02_015390 [Chaenocephalus aceratus]